MYTHITHGDIQGKIFNGYVQGKISSERIIKKSSVILQIVIVPITIEPHDSAPWDVVWQFDAYSAQIQY